MMLTLRHEDDIVWLQIEVLAGYLTYSLALNDRDALVAVMVVKLYSRAGFKRADAGEQNG